MYTKLFLVTVLTVLASSEGSPHPPPHKALVTSELQTLLQTKGKANIVVSFNQKTESILKEVTALKFNSRGDKITFLKERLEKLQAASQQGALNILKTGRDVNGSEIKFHSLWVNNKLYVEHATPSIIQTLASLPEVEKIREQFNINVFQEPQPAKCGPYLAAQNYTSNWGIQKMEADKAWELPGGNNGQGVVVGVVDSGVRYTHEALRSNWREDYGWFDPSNTSDVPRENFFPHGTHVTGIIVGTHNVGIAPGAKWIACQTCGDMESPACGEYSMTKCAEWVICPTLQDGTNSNCSMAAHVSSNSWGTDRENWSEPEWYEDVLKAYHAAGIIPVFGAGNSGVTGCKTMVYPGESPLAISVGASDIDDHLAYFSSKGPSRYDDSLQPDVTTPGYDILSTWHEGDDQYCLWAGTSMATPAASGVVALLMSRKPDLRFEDVKQILQNNADRETLSRNVESCGGTHPSEFPNNEYGYGRLNARRALQDVIDNY